MHGHDWGPNRQAHWLMMSNQIPTYEMDPVLMRGNEALIFINGHWQSMS